MKIRLHSHIDIFIEIDTDITHRNRTEPLRLDEYSLKVQEIKITTDIIKKFIATEIKIEDDLIVFEASFIDFIELLNCFTNNLLDIKNNYQLFYKKSGGYTAKIVSNKQEKYLKLTTAESNKEIFLSKYDCRVIVSNFNKIYSKCTRSEFA